MQNHIKDEELVGVIIDEIFNIVNTPENEIVFVPVKDRNGLLCGVSCVDSDRHISDFIQNLTEVVSLNFTRFKGVTKNRVKFFVSRLKKPVKLNNNGKFVYYWSWLRI